MEESETYIIPANYNNSGKILGGAVSLRNFMETIIIVAVIGYLELNFLPVTEAVKAIIMTVTLAPIAVFSCAGVDGDSLMRYFYRIIRFLLRRRILHFKRVDKYE